MMLNKPMRYFDLSISDLNTKNINTDKGGIVLKKKADCVFLYILCGAKNRVLCISSRTTGCFRHFRREFEGGTRCT